LLAGEESALREQSCFICAYAITQMNGAELIENGKAVATLSASANAHHWGRLSVQVHFRIGRGNMVTDIFTTKCDPKVWATSAVYHHFTTGQMPPLELDGEGRLAFL